MRSFLFFSAFIVGLIWSLLGLVSDVGRGAYAGDLACDAGFAVWCACLLMTRFADRGSVRFAAFDLASAIGLLVAVLGSLALMVQAVRPVASAVLGGCFLIALASAFASLDLLCDALRARRVRVA